MAQRPPLPSYGSRNRASRAPRRGRRWSLLLLLAAGAVWLLVQAYEGGWFDAGVAEAPTPDAPAAPTGVSGGPLRLLTWNVANLGGSKSDTEIGVVADVIAGAGADVVAIQEVITSEPGREAVERIAAALEARQPGAGWYWVVSDATSGRASERYAYLWRSDRVDTRGSFWLDATLEQTLDREPFMGRFTLRTGRQEPLLLASYHAPPTSRDPERELTLLPAIHRTYPTDDLVIVGDFNLDAQRAPFDGLRAEGFAQALPPGQKTTLKAAESPSGERLASAYDNVFYEPAELQALSARVLDFSDRFGSLRDAREVSDHLPVVVEFAW